MMAKTVLPLNLMFGPTSRIRLLTTGAKEQGNFIPFPEADG
jgi:hypothetical protein